MNTNKKFARGFTIIELLIVIVIIGALAALTLSFYTGLQAKARDVGVMSDVDHMDALQTSYGLKNKVAGKWYYSANGADSDLGFTPTPGNVITVIVNSTDYCIRGFNAGGTKNSMDNSYIKESTPGSCGVLVGVTPPPIPVVTVGLNGSNVQAVITPVTCIAGTTVQYSIRSHINDGDWTEYSTWSSTTTASQAVAEGVKYGYQAQARCYIDSSTYSTYSVSSEVTYTNPVNTPVAPVIAVVLDTGNVKATITPVTCTAGVAQYGINSRTNDGGWGGYTPWSSDLVATQTAVEGIKYDFQPQARCYVSDTASSPAAIGSIGTYTHPIVTIPAAPTVTATAINLSTTTYSWNTPTCTAGSSARYQYYFSTSYGYNSGWIATSSNSIDLTTSTFAQTYTLQVQAQCYSAYSVGGWSASGSASYYRPSPTVQVLVVAGGAGGGYDNGGGGGAGGVVYNPAVSVSSTGYSVGVGGGGGPQANGGNSTIFDITANGGGRGGNAGGGGTAGGSGGGGGGCNTNNGGAYTQGSSGGGTGYGHEGGQGGDRADGCAGGGGGGGGQKGQDYYNAAGTKMWGGYGMQSSITGSNTYYAGGGGGGGDGGYWGPGGTGGGGNGASGSGNTGGNATYYGSGGGGGSGRYGQGGYGYQGIVIISYATDSLSATGGNSVYTSGSNTVRVFTGSGTFTVN